MKIMMRGTFANIRLRNELAEGKVGGWTKYIPSGEIMPMYEAAMKYIMNGDDLVVIAGKEYGTGSSRDWAAKGTTLQGVKAVLAESFERIHRSNLIGMGVLPLQFPEGVNALSLGLDGTERVSIEGISGEFVPRMELNVTVTKVNGESQQLKALSRVDTADEVAYYQNGGILHYVLRSLA